MYGLGRLDLIVCKFHLARLKLFSGAKAQSNIVCVCAACKQEIFCGVCFVMRI